MDSGGVTVVGAGGRMGAALVRALGTERVPGLALAGALDGPNCPDLGTDAGALAGVGSLGIPVTADFAEATGPAEVLIDFTLHQVTAALAPKVAEAGKAWVIGTTGLDADETAAVEAAAARVPVVMAPNMSLGINLLFVLLADAARALQDRGYDIEILERHHRKKKDAPSGTALGLGKAVADALEWNLDEVACHGRSGYTTEDRPTREIGFHAIRAGDFAGDHTVLFSTEGESLEFSHRATTRDTFAMGALQAAAWVRHQAPGLYSMRDVLGL